MVLLNWRGFVLQPHRWTIYAILCLLTRAVPALMNSALVFNTIIITAPVSYQSGLIKPRLFHVLNILLKSNCLSILYHKNSIFFFPLKLPESACQVWRDVSHCWLPFWRNRATLGLNPWSLSSVTAIWECAFPLLYPPPLALRICWSVTRVVSVISFKLSPKITTLVPPVAVVD